MYKVKQNQLPKMVSKMYKPGEIVQCWITDTPDDRITIEYKKYNTEHIFKDHWKFVNRVGWILTM